MGVCQSINTEIFPQRRDFVMLVSFQQFHASSIFKLIFTHLFCDHDALYLFVINAIRNANQFLINNSHSLIEMGCKTPLSL